MINSVLPGSPVTEFMVRKAAHFLEYALLGLVALITLRAYTGRIRAYVTAPLFYGLLAAVADETLQLHIPGRSGQLTDVWIDFAGFVFGAVAGVLIILFVINRFRAGKRF
jgi:VanZ family protein